MFPAEISVVSAAVASPECFHSSGHVCRMSVAPNTEFPVLL